MTGDIMEDFTEVEVPFESTFMEFIDRTFRGIYFANAQGAHKLSNGQTWDGIIESNMDFIKTSLLCKHYDSFQSVYWKYNMNGTLSDRYGGDMSLPRDGWKALVVEYTAEMLGVDKELMVVAHI